MYGDQRYVWWSEIYMAIRDMYGDQRYVWWLEIYTVIRDIYGDQRYVWWSEICMVIRDIYGDQRYIWWSEICMVIRDIYGAQRYIWRSEIYMMIREIYADRATQSHSGKLVSAPGQLDRGILDVAPRSPSSHSSCHGTLLDGVACASPDTAHALAAHYWKNRFSKLTSSSYEHKRNIITASRHWYQVNCCIEGSMRQPVWATVWANKL